MNIPCIRDCGRYALDGHLTCGDARCDEASARDELARQSLTADDEGLDPEFHDIGGSE